MTKNTKTERFFEFYLKLISDRRPLIPYSEFLNQEWGDERTFRRLKDELNSLWEKYHRAPLFKIVDASGRETDRGDRFFKLVDKTATIDRVEQLAAFPAYFELMRVLKGTIIESELHPIYEKMTHELSKKEKTFLGKMEKKFFYLGKGIKDYSSKQDILDEVYSALIKEQKLSVRMELKGEIQERILLPLTLLMFNNGLYLIAFFDDQDQTTPPYNLKIESLSDAKALKGKTFSYPLSYHPSNLYAGEFGLIRGKNGKSIKVVLEFISDPWIKKYVKERKWTGEEEFKEKKDGKLLMTFKVSDLSEVTSFVLSFGSNVKVKEPKQLVSDIMNEHRIAVAAYRS